MQRSVGGRLRWYPVGLSLAYLMHVYVETGVHPAAAVRSAFVVLALTIAVQLLLTRALRDAERGAMVTAALLVLAAGAHPPIRMVAVIGLLGVVAVLIWWMLRHGRSLRRIGDLFQGVTAVLLVLGLVRFTISPLPALLAADLAPRPATGPRASASDPDIVVVLLDAYPGRRTLERVFGLDDDLADALRSRGFDVADDARSNYSQTSLTLASMFSFGLLDELPSTRDAVASGHLEPSLLRGVINDPPLLRLLRERGYRTVATASGWEDPAIRSADIFLDAGELNEFELSLVRSTAVSDLLALTGWDIVGDQLRSRYRSGLDQLASIAQWPSGDDRPTFAFVHLAMPHAPILFDENGGPIPVDLRTPFDYGAGLIDDDAIRKRYRAQLPYVDATFLEAFDTFLGGLPEEAVVVVFSDHGPRSRLDATAELRLLEGVDVLVAARTPGYPGLARNAATLVNLMPEILDAYLGTDLPRSPDRSWVSGGEEVLPLTEVPVTPDP